MNFLIADDYPSNRKLLRAQLESEGHSVHDVADGIEALEVLEHESIDAVISDILMPNMDGFRLCHEIRSNAKLFAIPVILFTSTYNSAGDRKLAETVGADCYLLKPAPTPVIMAAVRAATEKAALRTQTQPALPKIDEGYVLQQYNDALVRKLEARNTELQAAITNLEAARDEILKLNRNLEARVTERTTALDAANEELEAFTASVSHDLRAPLRNLSGFAHLLEASAGEQLNEEGKRLIARIRDAATHMNDLISDLLAFAHASRCEMRLDDVNLDALVDESIEDLEMDCMGRNVEWHRNPLPKVSGDAALLRQVFANLLSNAVKYTRPRDPAHIEIGCEENAAGERVIFIRDNGVGFDMQQSPQLFGVFSRLHSTKEFEGTGIGLANVRRIVSRHGGRVWAEGEVGHGATFYFTLHAPLDRRQTA